MKDLSVPRLLSQRVNGNARDLAFLKLNRVGVADLLDIDTRDGHIQLLSYVSERTRQPLVRVAGPDLSTTVL